MWNSILLYDTKTPILHLWSQDKDKSTASDNSVDLFLLDFGVFFIYIYSSLTITVGVFNIDPDIPGSVHVFNGVIEIIAVTFQTILIHQLLIKVVDYYSDNENG